MYITISTQIVRQSPSIPTRHKSPTTCLLLKSISPKMLTLIYLKNYRYLQLKYNNFTEILIKIKFTLNRSKFDNKITYISLNTLKINNIKDQMVSEMHGKAGIACGPTSHYSLREKDQERRGVDNQDRDVIGQIYSSTCWRA